MRKRRSGDGAASKANQPTAVKGGARIQEHRLANGMRVLVAERHDDPVVAVMLYYKAGARDESEREAGVSHFLEHMMFKGSAAFGKGEVDLATTVLGGGNNAYTGSDHTAYWFELASDRWEMALEIEADRMRRLTLDPAEFEAEKMVVLEELAMGEDDPWRNLAREVQMLLFPRHPYRRPVIGYEDTLRAMTVADMRDYYRRHYHPANATLVLCGDVKPRKALTLARKHFGSIEAGPPPEPTLCHVPPVQEPKGERRVTTSWDDSSRRLCIAWPTVPVGSEEDFALDLITTILTGGRLSRLHRRLVIEEASATSVSCSNDTRVDAGSFWVFAECRREVDPARLEASIDEEIARLGTELVPPAELRRARRMLQASEAYDIETVSDLAEDLGEWAVDSDWRVFIDSQRRFDAVKPRTLREVAARLLQPRRRVVGWSMPEDEADRARRAEGRS